MLLLLLSNRFAYQTLLSFRYVVNHRQLTESSVQHVSYKQIPTVHIYTTFKKYNGSAITDHYIQPSSHVTKISRVGLPRRTHATHRHHQSLANVYVFSQLKFN